MTELSETSKGYWTEDAAGFLDIVVIATEEVEANISRISLYSKYWYRVQNFLLNATTTECWSKINQLMRECGRTLPEPNEEKVYRITNLSLQQVNQMYYLLKHSLTSAKVLFKLQPSFSMSTSGSVVAPKLKRRHRKNKNKGWQLVGGRLQATEAAADSTAEDEE